MKANLRVVRQAIDLASRPLLSGDYVVREIHRVGGGAWEFWGVPIRGGGFGEWRIIRRASARQALTARAAANLRRAAEAEARRPAISEGLGR